MPRRTDIKSILIVGAGPIIIGQGCEFDYSGAQACKALREEGYRVILVNSNPATIMTDPDKAEDRERFKKAMESIGLECARGAIAHSMEEALQVQAMIGFPAIIRPSFTLGGTGGGIAYNKDELVAICERGLDASPARELLFMQRI